MKRWEDRLLHWPRIASKSMKADFRDNTNLIRSNKNSPLYSMRSNYLRWLIIKCRKLLKPRRSSLKPKKRRSQNWKRFWDWNKVREILSWAILLFKVNRFIPLDKNMKKKQPNYKEVLIPWMMVSANASR